MLSFYNRRQWEYTWCFVLLLTAVVILCCPDYLRGTDQYWYIADTNAITNGFHAVTNNFFPNSFTGNWNASPRPFVHNRPVIYLAGLLDMIIQHTLLTWRLINLACLLLTAVCVRKGAEYLLSGSYPEDKVKKGGMLAGFLYLLMPFNFWLVFQQLSTLFDGFLSALIFLYVFPRWITATGAGQLKWWLVLLFASLLFFLEREDHLLMILLAAAAWLWAKKRLWSKYLLFIPVLLVGAWLVKPLFPGHLLVKFPAYRLILEALPGSSNNMVSFLNPHIGEYSFNQLFHILIPKMIYNLKLQFIPQVKLLPLYYVFNFFILLTGLGIILSRKLKLNEKIRSYVCLMAGMLVSHFIIILVYQNHYRYMLSVLPSLTALAFTMYLCLYRYYRDIRKLILFLGIAAAFSLLCLDTVLSVAGLRDARQEQTQANILGTVLNKHVKPGEPLLSEWTGNAQIIGYMHRTAPCLYIDSAYIAENPAILNDPGVHWIITGKNSAVERLLEQDIRASYELPEGFVLNELKK